MKGGPSVRVLLDVALGDDADLAAQAAEVLKRKCSYTTRTQTV